MSSKFGLLLSMLFISLFICFGSDLFSIQYAYSDLDNISVVISYRISTYGTIDGYICESIENDYKVKFECLNNCSPTFGDIVTYRISREIKTLVMSNGNLIVAIARSAVIGYYG